MAMWIATAMLLANIGLVDANAFLGHVQPQKATGVLSAHSEQALLTELGNALGNGHRHATEKRLKRIEQMLSPMFGAMVKNEHGRLGPSAAGYMLHRIFVQRHGWFIRALEPANGSFAAWNTSTPTAVLEERVSDNVTQLFETRLGQQGLGLRELAILASALEHLVHLEALQRLNISYQGAGFELDQALDHDEAAKVLDVYMSVYILGFVHEDLNTLSGFMAEKMHSNINALYPTWPETQQFLREVYQSVAPERDYLYYHDVENVIAEIGERYGRFQDIECRQLKQWLVEVEDTSVGGAGRVRVADFYSKALNEGRWQFSETVDYLRTLGALDESDAANPRVIIPNYLSGPSNCVASSAYYSVCCIDECENILGQIEQSIAAPEASPSQILSAVSMISSATVSSNRTFSPWLQHRLEEVANHHGGVVPMHGRLFAQWLHYAYPRECQFPHVSGTINPERPEEILQKSNFSTEEEITCSEEQMKRIVESAPERKARLPGAEMDALSESGMWSLDEELVVWRQVGADSSSVMPSTDLFAFVRGIAAISAVMAFALSIIRKASPAGKTWAADKTDKYYV